MPVPRRLFRSGSGHKKWDASVPKKDKGFCPLQKTEPLSLPKHQSLCKCTDYYTTPLHEITTYIFGEQRSAMRAAETMTSIPGCGFRQTQDVPLPAMPRPFGRGIVASTTVAVELDHVEERLLGVHSELAIYALDMRLRRLFRDDELRADEAAVAAFGQQLEHFGLAR